MILGLILGCSQPFDKQVIEIDTTTEDTNGSEATVFDEGADRDEDGFGDLVDCDDSNPNIHPDAVDYSNDGVDQNCDGVDEDGLCADSCNFSSDGECDDGGFGASHDVCDLGTDCSDCGAREDNDLDSFYDIEDCDDTDPNVNPNGIELINDGIDQDCDGVDLVGLCSDECDYADDGECDDGGSNSSQSLCLLGTDCIDCGPRIDDDGDGWDSEQDCDETEAKINPSAMDQTCDGIDDDCDGIIDDEWNDDPYEPNDTTPHDFGRLNDDAEVYGYINIATDQDAFTFYAEDVWYLPDFGFDISLNNVPAQADYGFHISFIDEDGVDYGIIASVNNSGVGGSENYSFDGDVIPGGNEGFYTVTVYSISGASCQAPYQLLIVNKGWF